MGVDAIQWLTARDARVRPTKPSDKGNHQVLDGVVVKIGDRFPNGLAFPLDPAGPAHEVVECRCVALPA